MAMKNGCNSDMPKGPIGSRSTRMNPNSFARNNLAKGGVNEHQGGHKGDAKTSMGSAKRK